MLFINLLLRFANCVDDMANDTERLNFPKCFLSETPLLLINHLCCTNANYQYVLYILKEYLDVYEIVDRLFQNIIDYTPEKNAYSGIGIFITRSSSILSEFSRILFCDFSEDGFNPSSTDGETTISQMPDGIENRIDSTVWE